LIVALATQIMHRGIHDPITFKKLMISNPWSDLSDEKQAQRFFESCELRIKKERGVASAGPWPFCFSMQAF
jgi:hypothetical protein